MIVRIAIVICIIVGWQGCSTSRQGNAAANKKTDNGLFAIAPNAQAYDAKGTEFGYRVLSLESKYGFSVRSSDRHLLDSLVGDAISRIVPKPSYTVRDALTILQNIHRSLTAYGIQYSSETLLSTGLHERRLDCDLLSYVYLTVADALDLPIYGMQAPRHFFVMWDDGTNTILWETTNGRTETKDYYINSPTKGRIARTSIEQGAYLRKLTRDESLAVAMVSIGRNLSESNKSHADIIEVYSEALRKHPRNAIAYTNRGNMFERNDEITKAIQDHTRAIELDPNYALAYTNRGVAYMAAGNTKQAIADHSKCIKLDGAIAQAYFNRAYAYTRANQLNEAYNDYTRAIGLDASMTKAYYNRGNVAQKRGNMKQAISDYTSALARNPHYTEALYNRGVAHQEREEYAEAIQDYTEALKSEPNDINSLRNRAACYENINKNNEALRDYTRLIQLGNAESDIYFHRAHVYKRAKEYTEAIHDFDEAIARNTKDADSYYWRAVTRSEAGQERALICGDLRSAAQLGNKKADEAQKRLCK